MEEAVEEEQVLCLIPLAASFPQVRAPREKREREREGAYAHLLHLPDSSLANEASEEGKVEYR